MDELELHPVALGLQGGPFRWRRSVGLQRCGMAVNSGGVPQGLSFLACVPAARPVKGTRCRLHSLYCRTHCAEWRAWPAGGRLQWAVCARRLSQPEPRRILCRHPAVSMFVGRMGT